MTTIKTKDLESLIDIPDCRKCIHYWRRDHKEVCTLQDPEFTWFPDIPCDRYENEDY